MSRSSKVARHIKAENIGVGDIIRVTTKQADVRRSIVGCVAEIHQQYQGRETIVTYTTRLGVLLLRVYESLGTTAVVTLLGYNADFRIPDLELDLYPENDYVRP
jgi:hypothetical protein